MKDILDTVGNTAGLVYEEALRGLKGYVKILKIAFSIFGAGIIISLLLFLVGYFAGSGIMYSAGVFVFGTSLLLLLLALIPITALIRVVARKVPELVNSINTLICLAIMYSFVAVYVFVAHPWEQPILFMCLLALTGLITMITVLTGKTVNPDVFLRRAKISLTLISVLLVASWLIPKDFQKKAMAVVTNSVTNELVYSVGNINNIEFFDKVTGKPKIWYWLDAETGKYVLFSNPGFYRGTGEPLAPISIEAINGIKRYLVRQNELDAERTSQEIRQQNAQEAERQRIAQEEVKKESDRLLAVQEAEQLRIQREEQRARDIQRAEDQKKAVANIVPPQPVQQTPVQLTPITPTPEEVPTSQILTEIPEIQEEVQVLPPSTKIVVKATQEITNETVSEGDVFYFTLDKDIKDGRTRLFPKSATVELEVMATQRKTMDTEPMLRLMVKKIGDKRIYQVDLTIGPKNQRAKSSLIGAAIGGTIGALVGGGRGAAIGAVGGAGTGAVASRDEKIIRIKPGDLIEFIVSK
jgi:signal transduction histidine kinase